MEVDVSEQAAPDGLAGAALEEDVVGQDDGGQAVRGEHGHDVLEEVELLVRRGGEEVGAVVILALAVGLAVVADNAIALLPAERRIGQDDVVGAAGSTQQGVPLFDDGRPIGPERAGSA